MDDGARQYFSIDGIAGFLGVSRGSVYALLRQGMPSILVGERRIFSRAAVNAFMESRLRPYREAKSGSSTPPSAA